MTTARLSVHVKPGAAANQATGWREDVLEVRIAALPQQGQANAALIRFLAELLGLAPSRLSVVRGHSSRRKQVAIEGLDQGELWRRLGR